MSEIINISIIVIVKFLLILILNKLAHKLKLLDYPNLRKFHSDPIPYVGGLALGTIYLFIIFVIGSELTILNKIFYIGFISSLAGFIDDKLNLSPLSKIILQSVPVIIIISQGLYLNDIGNYELIGKISLGKYGMIFTFLCGLLIINAFNYSDGIDGLLSTIFLNIFIFFIILCFIFNNQSIGLFLIYILLPIVIFLFFNFSLFRLPKIFLGDSGSNLLGFLTGFVMIYLYKEIQIDASLLIWPVAFLIYEFFSTSTVRIIKNKNVFMPGSDHFHYQIGKLFNLNIIKINLVINFFIILLVLFGFFVHFIFGSIYSLTLFIILFFIYLYIKLKLDSILTNSTKN